MKITAFKKINGKKKFYYFNDELISLPKDILDLIKHEGLTVVKIV